MRFSVVGLSTIAKVGLGKPIGPVSCGQGHGWSLIVNSVRAVILCDWNLDEEVIIEVVKISRCGNQLNWIIRKT